MDEKPIKIKRSLRKILDAIVQERDLQDDKWGIQNRPNGTSDDVRLICEAINAKYRCHKLSEKGHLDWKSILTEEVTNAFATGNDNDLRKKLLQVAATAIIWIECIERRPASSDPRNR